MTWYNMISMNVTYQSIQKVQVYQHRRLLQHQFFVDIPTPNPTFINNNNNINNINTNDNLYSAVIMAEPLWEFTRFTRWIQHGARWPPTFWSSQSASATGPPTQAARKPYSPLPLSLLSPKADTHINIPKRIEGWDDLSGCYIPRWFTCPYSHPSTNRPWHRVR